MTENKRTIKAEDSEGNVLYFKSKYSAGKHCGCSAAMVHLVCEGKSKEYRGGKFSYCELPPGAKHTVVLNEKHKKTIEKYGTEEAWKEEKKKRNKIYAQNYRKRMKGIDSDESEEEIPKIYL